MPLSSVGVRTTTTSKNTWENKGTAPENDKGDVPPAEHLLFLYPRRESNSDQWFRKPLFYPLNYKGIVPIKKRYSRSPTIESTANIRINSRL